MKKLLSEVSGMTNHEYLKQQSPEWLAVKLAEIMDCDCCPAAVYAPMDRNALRTGHIGMSEDAVKLAERRKDGE